MNSQILRTFNARFNFRVLNLKCLQAAVYSNRNYHQFKKCNLISFRPQASALVNIQQSAKMSSQLIKEIDFEGVKALGNDDNVLIIDVREPNELQETGTIPGSVNIPSGNVEKALNLDEDDFHSLYGHQKPPKDFPLVFTCRSGKRSIKASVIAIQLGYTDVSNYTGGWMDWEKNIKA